MNDTPLILVVDDDPLLLRAMVRLLNQAGYRTCQASDGLTGLQLARDQKPDLTLLDVNLPDLSGVEVCRRIKTDPALAGRFVVLVSGSRIDSQSQVDGLEGGADGYIARPVTNEELLARVRGMLRLKHAEDRLRESAEKYRTVADFTYDWEAWRAPDGNYVYISPSCERITGYTAAEFMADPNLVVKIAHPEDASQVSEHYDLTAHPAQEPVQNLDFRILTLAGETRWLNHYCVAVYGEDGRWLGRRESNRDVTERKQVEDALRESENHLTSLFETMDEGVVLITLDGQIAQANLAAQDILGLSQPEITSRNYIAAAWEIVRPDGTPMPPEEMAGPRAMVERRPVRDIMMGVRKPDGVIRWIDVSASPLITKAGAFEGVVGTFADITERKNAEDSMRERNRELALLNQASQALSATLDSDQVLSHLLDQVQRILHAIGAFWLSDPLTGELVCHQATGPFAEKLKGWRLQPGEGIAGWVAQNGISANVPDTFTDSRHSKGVTQHTGFVNRSILSVPLQSKQGILGVLQVMDAQVNRFTEWHRVLLESLAATAAIAIENAQLYAAAQQEIVERQATSRELEHALAREQNLARTDPLTGVGNRLRFFEFAEHEFQVALRYQHPLSVIMLDIDHFKQVNDTYGHAVGDRALMLIARAAQTQLRSPDVLARYGGEEFVALLPATDATQAAILAERIRECVAALAVETDTRDAHVARMTVSIGVAVVLPGDASIDVVMRRADDALYAAKEAGRNQVQISK